MFRIGDFMVGQRLGFGKSQVVTMCMGNLSSDDWWSMFTSLNLTSSVLINFVEFQIVVFLC